ncbi:MAG: HlyC/CorC family transporter [Chloroflexi bacterium]|nr:HlyC/CorC family transporter [Chloroflexota bacterium]
MDAEGWLELVVALGGLVFWAMLEGAEQALAQVDSASASTLPAVSWLRQRQRLSSVSLLIYKNLALVAVSAALAALLLDRVSPPWWALVLAVVGTLALATVLYLVVRGYIRGHASGSLRRLSGLLKVLVAAGYPLAWMLRLKPEQRAGSVSLGNEGPGPEEPGEPPGEPEQRMIQGIIGLGRTTVREIMVPRLDMVAVEENMPLHEVVQLVEEKGYSRIPIYRDTPDQIVGVVHVKDLLSRVGREPPTPLSELARPPFFIPESKRVDECLEEFLRERLHMAIVVDEYGDVAGLVTMEDVIEEIVGEIGDEYQREEPGIQRLSDEEALIDGRVSIADVNEALGLELPSEEFDTLGGLVLTRLGHIPAPGEMVEAHGVRLTVVSTVGRRVRQVKLTRGGGVPTDSYPDGEATFSSWDDS